VAWCAANGIDLSSIVAVATDPKGDRRDIGDISPANDGTMRATRQTRKHDLSFQSIPLAASDARAWEGLLAGEGHVWSFDSTFYSSKGLPGIASGDATINTGTKKYGAASLRIANDSSTWDTSGLRLAAPYTLALWHSSDAGPFSHYIIRSDGAKWVNGVRNDAASTSFASVVTTELELSAPTAGAYEYFDDLIVTPFLWPTSWSALVHASSAAFSSLPYLNFSGDLITEAATRTMIGTVNVAKLLRGNPTGVAGGAAKTVQVLQVDLKER
jgi:hypothetical protein